MKLRPASRLPGQLHLHWLAPDASGRIRPVSMAFPGHVMRRPGQAFGGLWTASPNQDGSSACIDMAAINVLRRPRGVASLRLWRMAPDPTATLAVIEHADDYQVLVERYPYPAGGIDIARLLREVDGLHVTAEAALSARCAPVIQSERDVRLGMFVYESTHWRRFAFVTCEEIPLDSAVYSLPGRDDTYLPAVIAAGHVPTDPPIRAAILADLEARNRVALDAVAPVMDWLRRRQIHAARAGPAVAAD